MFSDNEKLNVFDKDKQEYRCNQPIENIACQNKFYDFTQDEIESLKDKFSDLSEQYIEGFEGFFSKMPDFLAVSLGSIVDFSNSLQYRNATRCLFIREEEVTEKCWHFINEKSNITNDLISDSINVFSLIDSLSKKSFNMNVKDFITNASMDLKELKRKFPEIINRL